MVPEKYCESYVIPGYFIDNKARLRPSSFFDIAQELAVRGSTQLGAPDSVLHRRGVGWILIRNAIHFDCYPHIEQPVTLETWHSGVTGPFFTRDYLCIDESGQAIIRATSSWALMDINSRTVVKPERIMDIFPAAPQCNERALQPNAAKVFFPHDCLKEVAGSHLVTYSDLDYNNHANNGKYPHWAMDCLPEEVSLNGTVTDFELNYNRELKHGETVEFVRALGPDGAWYVEGICNGLQCFICRILLAGSV